ncbi:MAG: YHS domain-containing protein [Thermodesulfobacteriota bacterium]
MAQDPVCRMQVEEEKAAATAEHNGKQYYFCCSSCQEKFMRDPDRYLQALEQPK